VKERHAIDSLGDNVTFSSPRAHFAYGLLKKTCLLD
jgi:hypothetical protein